MQSQLNPVLAGVACTRAVVLVCRPTCAAGAAMRPPAIVWVQTTRCAWSGVPRKAERPISTVAPSAQGGTNAVRAERAAARGAAIARPTPPTIALIRRTAIRCTRVTPKADRLAARARHGTRTTKWALPINCQMPRKPAADSPALRQRLLMQDSPCRRSLFLLLVLFAQASLASSPLCVVLQLSWKRSRTTVDNRTAATIRPCARRGVVGAKTMCKIGSFTRSNRDGRRYTGISHTLLTLLCCACTLDACLVRLVATYIAVCRRGRVPELSKH